ncbi:transposase family protein [Streptomyces sp. NPDC019539]|uniref:transposase family protein n=1 Tax=Streptomyces sp. NPDC019539 TaxID=3365063 RepID=UPI0037A1BD4D
MRSGGVNEGVRPAGRDAATSRPYRRRPTVPLGQHKKHGVNVQVVTDLFGRLLWASPALPGPSTTSARPASTVSSTLSQGAGIVCWADKGYQGAGGTVRVPYRGRWETLSTGRQAVNRSHAKIRALRRHPQVLAASPQAPLLDGPVSPKLRRSDK